MILMNIHFKKFLGLITFWLYMINLKILKTT